MDDKLESLCVQCKFRDVIGLEDDKYGVDLCLAFQQAKSFSSFVQEWMFCQHRTLES